PYGWEEQWQITTVKEQPVAEGNSNQPNLDQNSQALISINTADSKSLEALPGIGEKRASDIIANRPYGSINELLTKEVLTQTLFDEIKELISI
ncbi:MAG TPA: helix-hairpin-helix domain-containing protein, partial [Candidatus Woesebacteria bacterium]|nr:helix-hairpin-helix domain-containing protein [Candidatus Woesebacteria bacterium]